MAEKKYIMAIDQGMTSSRAIIFDKKGNKIGSPQKEPTQYFPNVGWVEHNANEIWNSVQSVIIGSLIESGVKPTDIAGIGITNQRETTAAWGEVTRLPIYSTVVWQSYQTAPIVDQLKEDGYSETIHEKIGLIIGAYFSATKVRWILDHVEGVQERAENGELMFGIIDTWLVWKLTGDTHVTDYSNAGRMILFNIHDLDQDQEILDLLDIPRVTSPKVVSSSEVYGLTKDHHFYRSGVPITGMAGNQRAALFGQMVLESGMVKNIYGTGSFIVANTDEEPQLSKNDLLTTIGYGINGKVHYALEGSIFVAGSAIQWLRDGLKMLQTAAESEAVAKASTGHNEAYVVPVFTGLDAPYWDSQVHGVAFGLTRGTMREDFVKATLQAVACQVRNIIDTMKEDTGTDIPVLRVDDGAANNDFLTQLQADILNTAARRTHSLETTALGAAFLTGLAIGFWKDLEEIKAFQEEGQ